MQRHKVLIVDDNHELLRLLARLVEDDGWQPVTCARGKAALDAIATEKPAVAIVDVLLPDMMGYEIGAALRKAGIPYIFMTGIFKGGRAASEARVQHGAAGYFEKPFEAKKLLEAIRGLLPPEPPPLSSTSRTAAMAAPAPSGNGDDFDLEVAVEPEEQVDALSLTGKVQVSEAGNIVAVIRGDALLAASVAGRVVAPPPLPRPPRAEPPDEGELRDNLPELVTAFFLAQQTGELALQRGKVRKALYFEKGRPCYAISNLVADRFGPFLVRVGKLTQPQLELCEQAAGKTGRKAGEVLVDMGILKGAEMLYYVAQQVKAIAYSLFAWEEGRYRIYFADRAAKEATKVEMNPSHLIARGVKKLYRPERLARLLPNATRLIPTQQPAYGLHEVELEPWEAQLLPRVNGTRTVAELVAAAKKPESAVRAILWALVALEILEVRE